MAWITKEKAGDEVAARGAARRHESDGESLTFADEETIAPAAKVPVERGDV